MKAYLRELIAPHPNPLLQIHLVREYLQARTLFSLQRAGAMHTLAFHGGTSLRFLYDIPRYSEDLDFALESNPGDYDFRRYLTRIERDFSTEAYEIDTKLSDKRAVHKAFVRFRGLLYELGLSAHATEVLAIKIEVDTNPPPDAGLMTTPVQRHVPLNLHHHDPATLFAGKLAAVLGRIYLKGRDIYDLWWYLSQPDWPEPNLVYLNQALQQHDGGHTLSSSEHWRSVTRQRIEATRWSEVLEDVAAFLIEPASQRDFNKARLLKLLS